MSLAAFFRKITDLFIFSSLFIACCAVLMVWQTTALFGFPLSRELAGFVFSGTVSSYNFHWFLTPALLQNPSKKLAWSVSNKRLHLFLAVAGLMAAGFFAFFLLRYWPLLALIGGATFLYSAPKIAHPLFISLRKLAVGKTIYLALVWALITALLPLLMHFDQPGPAHILFFINRFFFIYAICILFDYRDVEEDRRAGIRSLITYFSEKGIDRLFWASQLIVLVTLALLLPYFSWPVLVALGLPPFILSLLYRRAKRDFSDYLYYFVLDGLMMLSAPLVLLAKFAR